MFDYYIPVLSEVLSAKDYLRIVQKERDNIANVQFIHAKRAFKVEYRTPVFRKRRLQSCKLDYIPTQVL